MIHIANAPVSWGIFEFEGTAQQYTYQQVMDQIAATGYTGMESGPWGFLPTDTDLMLSELAARKLSLLSAFVPCNFADAAAQNAAEAHALKVGRYLAALGAVCVVLADDNGKVPELVKHAGRRTGSALSNDQWDTYAAGVNRVARTLFDATGLKVTFHHHGAGYVETPEEVRRLLARTDADLVGLCLDTGHYHFGGGDAVEAIREFGARVRYLHLKDCDLGIRDLAKHEKMDYFATTAAGVFCELGKGAVDFPGILSAMEALGYQGWAIVEQDILVDDLDAPRQSAARNRDYLRKLGY